MKFNKSTSIASLAITSKKTERAPMTSIAILFLKRHIIGQRHTGKNPLSRC